MWGGPLTPRPTHSPPPVAQTKAPVAQDLPGPDLDLTAAGAQVNGEGGAGVAA